MFTSKYIILCLQIVFVVYAQENIVEIEQGKLKGKTSEDYNGNKYYSFQGIPYAKPPIGELRFKAPIPAEPWKDIFDATKEGNECYQYDALDAKLFGDEDCLNLNVYTPELPNNEPLKPVMVWIHGGAFNSGSGGTKLYGPEFLITEDVVIVTINYRIGILGFLSLEDTSLGVPGNAGLKDMVLALKWVQNNIKHFNGDPNNVTIFGESAGSASCHYLTLSESAIGLFHRAILQSGVAINPWAMGQRKCIEVANVLQSNATNEKEALEFLKTTPPENLVKALAILANGSSIQNPLPFTPIIEKPNPEAFITEHPLDLMSSGRYNKVPIIIGYTSREDFESAIPADFNITKGSELSKRIGRKIKEFYFGRTAKSDEDNLDNFHILTSDLFFVRGIIVTTRVLLNTTNEPVYLYRFNIDTNLNIFKRFARVTSPGACHADDIGYIFKTKFTPKIEPNSDEEIGFKRVIKLWANFAKTGNPTPDHKDPLLEVEWPPSTPNDLQSLDIDKTLKITKNPDEERMKFWDEIDSMDEINSPYQYFI